MAAKKGALRRVPNAGAFRGTRKLGSVPPKTALSRASQRNLANTRRK
jgi:hypothetical protein